MGVTLGLESTGHMECVYCRDVVCILPLSFKEYHSADKDLGRGVVFTDAEVVEPKGLRWLLTVTDNFVCPLAWLSLPQFAHL